MKRVEYNVKTGEKIETEITQQELERYAKDNSIAEYRLRINELKAQVKETDYRVIKCYEHSLMGLGLPYDIQELHKNRQAMRNEINELEAQISALQGA